MSFTSFVCACVRIVDIERIKIPDNAVCVLGCSSHGVCENFECSCQSGWAPPDCSLSKQNISMLHFCVCILLMLHLFLSCLFCNCSSPFLWVTPQKNYQHFSVCNFMSTTNSVDKKIIAGTCAGLKCVHGKCYNGHCYCDLVRNTEKNLVVFYSFAINFVRTGEIGARTYCDLYHTYRKSWWFAVVERQKMR